jgi:positive regulator of sigma E activity
MATFKEEGTVEAIEGTEARIRIPRGGSCAGCGGCSAASDPREMSTVVRKVANLREGDRVLLEGKTPSSITGGLTIFILPLALFVLGFAGGQTIALRLADGPGGGTAAFSPDLFGGVLGVVFAALPYLLLFLRRRIHRRRGAYELTITGILGRDSK